MANSKLATYRNHTSMNGGKRVNKIMGITPHYMADNNAWTGKNCADYFATSGRTASSNYCIGKAGDIAVSVDEDWHPYTSANWQNDDTHVTIEVSNTNNSTGELSAAAYNSLINLCADICTRHNIVPSYNKAKGTASTITMHKDVGSTPTACPGPWLSYKITTGEFERDILKKMGQKTTTTATTNNSKLETYQGYVEVTYSGNLAIHSIPSWADSTVCGYVKKGEVFTIVGRQKVEGVYMYKLKSGKYITSSDKYVKYRKTINKAEQTARKKSNQEIAQEVIAGKWGNGAARKQKLEAAGYDYNAIQKIVNTLV